jgi:5-methylcytosine-specific restriction enzyme subunit McrC
LNHELIEFQAKTIPRADLTDAQGTSLWQTYKHLLDVDFPSVKTAGDWQVTSKGIVGFIPIGEGQGIRIQPKAKVSNIFQMWELAYQVRLQWLTGVTTVASVDELYSQIVGHLADQVLLRIRKGIYRAYVGTSEALPYVRGRIDLNEALRKPHETKLVCDFEEHTADIEDNQLILAALRVGAQSGACTNTVRPRIRRAYWSLRQSVTPEPSLTAARCLRRGYGRLNADYEPLHHLSYFILQHAAPSHQAGPNRLQPFTIDMAKLFERFVAEWVTSRAGHDVKVDRQKGFSLTGAIAFQPDLVIRERITGEARVVLDTKYKLDRTPDASDVGQIVAYCEALGCHRAVLLYPVTDILPVDFQVGDIRVQNLSFDLDSDMEAAGVKLLGELTAN